MDLLDSLIHPNKIDLGANQSIKDKIEQAKAQFRMRVGNAVKP